MITRLVTSAHDLKGVADESIHLIVESSPYYHLRQYEGNQETDWPDMTLRDPFDAAATLYSPALRSALGWEPRPQDYLAHLMLCLREHWRVLRNDGVLFFNMADKWADATVGEWGVKGKEALMLPQRLALLAQADGWYVRHAAIPWVKLNSVPNSNQDRLVMMHEDILMLTKSRDYYFDPDAIRRPGPATKRKGGRANYTANYTANGTDGIRHGKNSHTLHQPADERGRLCRTSDVWTDSLEAIISHLEDYSVQLRRIISGRNGAVTDDNDNLAGMLVNVQAYKGDHYAGWPERLVELLIRAGTSERGCCPVCGRQWIRRDNQWSQACDCPAAAPVPSTVGDFFAGTCLSGRVAARLRRWAVMADISDYYLNDLADERLDGIQIELF